MGGMLESDSNYESTGSCVAPATMKYWNSPTTGSMELDWTAPGTTGPVKIFGMTGATQSELTRRELTITVQALPPTNAPSGSPTTFSSSMDGTGGASPTPASTSSHCNPARR